MKLLFIPSWNGHLYLQEHKETSVTKLFSEIKSNNKTLVNIEKNNIEKTNKIIEKTIQDLNENFLAITGDHSNTYPLVKAFAKQNLAKDFVLVIFDAHPDVEVSTDAISHEDYLRNLIEDSIVKPETVYLFGLRTFSRTEFEYLVEKKINFYTITDILKDKEKIIKILEKIAKKNVYLSVDIDSLDPDDAPGTYYTEWCGLYIDELLEFIEILKPKIKSADITEYYLEKDEDDVTKKNVFKIIDKISN